jgi:hypothetical protein
MIAVDGIGNAKRKDEETYCELTYAIPASTSSTGTMGRMGPKISLG